MKGFRSLSTVTIKFETRYTDLDTTQQCLALSGSVMELGNWDERRCVPAEEDPVGSGNWAATVEMLANEGFYWKWVVVALDRSEVFRWEELENREEFSGEHGGTVTAMWNGPSVWVTAPDNSDRGFRLPRFMQSFTNILQRRRSSLDSETAWCTIV